MAAGADRSDGPPKGSNRLRALLLVSDLVATSAAFTLTALGDRMPTAEAVRFTLWSVVVTMAFIAMNRLYLARVCSLRALETAALLRANLLAGAVIALGQDRIDLRTDAAVLVLAQVLALCAVMIGRALYRAGLRRARRRGRFMRRVVLIGTGDEAFELCRLLDDEPELGYEVVAVVGDRAEALRRGFPVPVAGSIDDAVDVLRAAGAGGAIIGASSVSFRDLNRVVRDLLQAGAHVQISGGLAGIAASRFRANPIGREAAFYLEKVSLAGWQARVKRALDIVGSVVLLIPALPIMGVLALLVRRHDGGPAFFRQTRIGLDNREFTILKLRTMVVDAEARRAELKAANERHGPLFKMKNDPRLTPIGRFMDATSLNELPQLFNVLRGEMSLVGLALRCLARSSSSTSGSSCATRSGPASRASGRWSHATRRRSPTTSAATCSTSRTGRCSSIWRSCCRPSVKSCAAPPVGRRATPTRRSAPARSRRCSHPRADRRQAPSHRPRRGPSPSGTCHPPLRSWRSPQCGDAELDR